MDCGNKYDIGACQFLEYNQDGLLMLISTDILQEYVGFLSSQIYIIYLGKLQLVLYFYWVAVLSKLMYRQEPITSTDPSAHLILIYTSGGVLNRATASLILCFYLSTGLRHLS